MTGSPGSSPSSTQMMLRSQCRSTPDLVPSYCFYINPSIWILLLICLATHYLTYVQYILPMTTKTEETQNLIVQLKKNYEKCVKHTEESIRKEITLYDADKTNLADYALEPSGGTIVTTRCTKTYLDKNIQYSIDGILPVFFTSNSPRVVIQPTMTPGECWSFTGAEGVLVVQLSRTIIPTSFTYEHIRKELTPDLHIDSAPRHFRVKSLKDANDLEGLLLGEYDYDKDGEPLQQFQVQNPNPVPTRFIELIVQSNHGEMQYTCLYRFRVHGIKY